MRRIKVETIVLGFICAGFVYLGSIFGVDTILSLEPNSTISEWLHYWALEGKNAEYFVATAIAFIVGIVYFVYHVLFFKPK